MGKPNKVILHCAATPDQGDLIGLEQIDEWHKDRGWKGVGYQWVIRRSGEIEKGREETATGAHTLGHNRNSIGICLVGTKDFTAAQVTSLMVLAQGIRSRHGIEAKDWYCHYQFANKRCPNIPVEVVRKLVRHC